MTSCYIMEIFVIYILFSQVCRSLYFLLYFIFFNVCNVCLLCLSIIYDSMNKRWKYIQFLQYYCFTFRIFEKDCIYRTCHELFSYVFYTTIAKMKNDAKNKRILISMFASAICVYTIAMNTKIMLDSRKYSGERGYTYIKILSLSSTIFLFYFLFQFSI